MNSTHCQYIATATAEALRLLDAKTVDREALRRLLNNMHVFARDQAIMTQPDSPRYLGNRLKQWRY